MPASMKFLSLFLVPMGIGYFCGPAIIAKLHSAFILAALAGAILCLPFILELIFKRLTVNAPNSISMSKISASLFLTGGALLAFGVGIAFR